MEWIYRVSLYGVGKGGAFSRHPFQCRSGIRWFAVLDYRVSYTGFRLWMV